MNIKSLLELEERIDYFSQFSFDVFDTLIFRKVEGFNEREAEISKLVTEYLKSINIDCDFQDYMTLREIEFSKSKLKTLDEVDYFLSLRNILSELNAPEEDILSISNQVWKIEEKYETSVCYANPEALEILPKLKAAGKNIIAISDMYLPNSSVREILNSAGLLKYFDNVYVSSDNYLTKHSGEIYADLLKRGLLDQGNVVHTGDNYHSDELMAAKNLIFGLHYVNHKNEVRKQSLQTKMEKNYKIEQQATSDDLVDLLSQSFALFLKQIFDMAKKYKSENIYFFTRDANFLINSAEAYKNKFNVKEIELHTLHLDRLNSFFLNIDTLDKLEKHLWLFGEPQKVTIMDFLEKLGYLSICLEKYGDIIESNRDITLKMALVTNHLKEIILEVVRIKNANVINYLSKIGVFSNKNSILVDIGYSGTSMREISLYIDNLEDKSKQGRLDCLLYSSNRFFNINAVQFLEPVYLHLPRVFPFHKANFFSTLNHSWLEPFVLDTSLGALQRYDEKTLIPIRDKFERTPVYQKVALNEKIESYFSNLDEIDLQTLQYKLGGLIALPSKEQANKYSYLTHTKGFDNSLEQEIIGKVSILNMKNDILSLIKDDYWIGASLAKANLSFLVKIAGSKFYYAKKFFKV